MAHLLLSAELWALEFGDDAIRCIASSHPLGFEVRYLMNEQPLMARVLPDWDDAAVVAESWRENLEARGWVRATPAAPVGWMH